MTEQAEQKSLLPTEIPVPEEAQMSILELPQNRWLDAPEPSKSLIDSVRRFGIMNPLHLQKMGNRVTLRDGRRRLKTARMLDAAWKRDNPELAETEASPWDQVPVKVWNIPVAVGNAMTVMANAIAEDNRISDYKALNWLRGQGYSEQAIHEATGLEVQEIRERLRVGDALIDPLWAAFERGKMGVTTAKAASKLTRTQQERLLPILQSKGKIQGKDVREARTIRRAEAIAELDFGSILDTPALKAAPLTDDQVVDLNPFQPDNNIAVAGRSEDGVRRQLRNTLADVRRLIEDLDGNRNDDELFDEGLEDVRSKLDHAFSLIRSDEDGRG